jgi:diadenosine tetraphosphate (Ap4A) HIT family hydrolase
MPFNLHPNFLSKDFVSDLTLCSVLLENNKNYPWIFLIPRRENVFAMMDLSKDDQALLMKEIDLAQKVLYSLFKPTQLNVAAIGNKTRQLHIHVIARFDNDPAWPGTVWDHSGKSFYSEEEKKGLILKLKGALEEEGI